MEALIITGVISLIVGVIVKSNVRKTYTSKNIKKEWY
jgi:hypothetical protein